MQNLHRGATRSIVSAALFTGLFVAVPLAHANGQEIKQSVSPGKVYQNITNGDQHVLQVVTPGHVHQDIQNGDQHVVQDVGHLDKHPNGTQTASSSALQSNTQQPVLIGNSVFSATTLAAPVFLPNSGSSGGSGGGSNHRQVCNPLPDDRVNSGAADAMAFCLLPAQYPEQYLDYSRKPEWLNWYSNFGQTWSGWDLLQPTPRPTAQVLSIPAPVIPDVYTPFMSPRLNLSEKEKAEWEATLTPPDEQVTVDESCQNEPSDEDDSGV